MKQKTNREQAKSWGDKVLLFAGGTVSPMMCPADGQQKDDENARPRTSQDEIRDKAEKKRE